VGRGGEGEGGKGEVRGEERGAVVAEGEQESGTGGGRGFGRCVMEGTVDVDRVKDSRKRRGKSKEDRLREEMCYGREGWKGGGAGGWE